MPTPLYYARRALEMPPHQVVARAARRLRNGWQAIQERRRDFTRTTYATIRDQPAVARLLPDVPVDVLSPHCERVLSVSEQLLKHRFNLLGSGLTEVHRPLDGTTGNDWVRQSVSPNNAERSAEIWNAVQPSYRPIDWHCDWKTGSRWSARTWFQDSAGHAESEGNHGSGLRSDVKLPWELARCQHFPQLAWAFALAAAGQPGFRQPQVYVDELQNQILDFLATNPPRFGPNWACTMDVAIRVANWLYAYDLLRAAGAEFGSDFERHFVNGLYDHGRHIISQLEWDPDIRGNHYLADIAGLCCVGAWLPSEPETDEWLSFGMRELWREVGRQFWPDGANFEASTSYHRLSAEMVLYAVVPILAVPGERFERLLAADLPRLFPRPGNPSPTLRSWNLASDPPAARIPDSVREALFGMARFTAAITRADGRIPQIGDNDSGRFLKLWPDYRQPDQLEEDCLNHRHLVAALGGLFPDSEFAVQGQGFPHPERWLVERVVGPALNRKSTEFESSSASPWRVFPDFGLYRFDAPPWSVVFRCGPVGQCDNGGHAHNDQLSFELSVGDRPVFVDPGTYVYTASAEQRNRFRGTAMHNTLSFPGREQNDWEPGRIGLFRVQHQSHARLVSRGGCEITGQHVGFGLPHVRTLTMSDSRIEGHDNCELAGPRQIAFHLQPGVGPGVLQSGEVRLIVEGVTLILCSDDGEWRCVESHHSLAYGHQMPAHCWILDSTATSVRWSISRD